MSQFECEVPVPETLNKDDYSELSRLAAKLVEDSAVEGANNGEAFVLETMVLVRGGRPYYLEVSARPFCPCPACARNLRSMLERRRLN